MKTRLIYGQKVCEYSDEFISENWNKVINGVLVSEWELIDYVPNNEVQVIVPPISKKQRFKLALLKLFGITNDQVLSVIEQIPDNYKKESIKILWIDSDFYERADENLNSLAKGIFKLTDEQIDQIFIIANQ